MNGSQIDELIIPETVTAINRNAFWNCKGIKKVVITKNIVRIGYNPFASAENMYLESESPEIISRDGILYDKTMTNLLCATNRAVGKSYRVPDSVKIINRGVFSGCKDLEEIDFNGVITLNETAKFMWEAAKGDFTEQDLQAALIKQYGIDAETAKSAVDSFVTTMKEEGCIE